MQRVRIGLTGLAFVFLAVMLAMVFTREPAGEMPITPNMLEPGQPPPAPPPANPTEPLAELGVAPGNADSNATAPDADPTLAAPPAR